MMADAVDRLFEGLPPTITLPITAEILGISKKGVYDMVRRGVIPAYRLGGHWYVICDELKERLREGSNAGLQAPTDDSDLDEELID